MYIVDRSTKKLVKRVLHNLGRIYIKNGKAYTLENDAEGYPVVCVYRISPEVFKADK